jgi:transposase
MAHHPVGWASWLTAGGTIVLAIFGFIALFIESRRYRCSQSVDLVLKFEERFNSPTWARCFFGNWKQAFKWQRLKPYEEFARMVDRHWDGIATYCHIGNEVPLGFVEGFNNKIRVLQRRAYGLREEEYLRLKSLTCMLPEI